MKSFCGHENAIFAMIFHRYIDKKSWQKTNDFLFFHENAIFSMIFRHYIDKCSWKNTNGNFFLPRECYIFHDLSSPYRRMFMAKHKWKIFVTMRML
jgi:hypothetical protein